MAKNLVGILFAIIAFPIVMIYLFCIHSGLSLTKAINWFIKLSKWAEEVDKEMEKKKEKK